MNCTFQNMLENYHGWPHYRLENVFLSSSLTFCHIIILTLFFKSSHRLEPSSVLPFLVFWILWRRSPNNWTLPPVSPRLPFFAVSAAPQVLRPHPTTPEHSVLHCTPPLFQHFLKFSLLSSPITTSIIILTNNSIKYFQKHKILK